MAEQVLQKQNKSYLRKVIALLEYRLRQRSSQLLWGRHVSIFKGQGMNYKNHRHYQFGDDVRAIDWKVTARTTKPYIKEFEQESEMQTYFIIDTSASMYFGHDSTYKFHRVLDYVSLFGQLLLGNEDKIGLIYHNGEKLNIIKPKKGEKNLRIILKALSTARPIMDNPKLIYDLIDVALRLRYRNGGIIIISDFLNEMQSRLEFSDKVAQLSINNDVFITQILDKYEVEFDYNHKARLKDLETKLSKIVKLNPIEQEKYRAKMKNSVSQFHLELKKRGILSISARTEVEPIITVKKLLS
jgi:uncharacterized protein (DUF58 family)